MDGIESESYVRAVATVEDVVDEGITVDDACGVRVGELLGGEMLEREVFPRRAACRRVSCFFFLF